MSLHLADCIPDLFLPGFSRLHSIESFRVGKANFIISGKDAAGKRVIVQVGTFKGRRLINVAAAGSTPELHEMMSERTKSEFDDAYQFTLECLGHGTPAAKVERGREITDESF